MDINQNNKELAAEEVCISRNDEQPNADPDYTELVDWWVSVLVEQALTETPKDDRVDM